MAGNQRKRAYVREKHGVGVQTCPVAHVKAELGLTRGTAPNRIDPNTRVKLGPPDLRPKVEEAVRAVHGLPS